MSFLENLIDGGEGIAVESGTAAASKARTTQRKLKKPTGFRTETETGK